MTFSPVSALAPASVLHAHEYSEEASLASILSLLGTNAVPSEDQKDAIKNILAQRAQSRILVTSRSFLSQAPTDQLAALITPARTILPEILSMIFESCVSGQKALPRPLVHKAPLVLTQICSKWRRIAIDSTPKIWSSILLSDSGVANGKPKLALLRKHALSLKLWLSRTGCLPITCHIQYSPYNFWHRDETICGYVGAAAKVVDELAQHVSQWKDISLCLSVDCLQPLLGLQGVEAPLLQSFSLSHIAFGPPDYWTAASGRNNMRVPDISIAPLLIQPGPKLRVLRLDIPEDTFRLAPLWTGLEELIMVPSPCRRSEPRSYFTAAAALKLLRQFPQLKRCTLSVTKTPGNTPIEEELECLAMPLLTMLSLQTDDIAPLLTAMTLPALRRLQLRRKCPAPTLRSFLAGLSRPLIELSLVRIPTMTDEELIACLELIPTVTHLHITAPMGPLSLRALTPAGNGADALSSPCLCPDLDYIEVRCWRPFDTLVDMVEARCDAFRGEPAKLRVRLHLHSKPLDAEGASENETALLGRLERCRDRGFNVKWQL